MLNLHDPLIQIKITESVCAFVAISVTLYRLYVRRNKFWIDDIWATFALLTLFAQIAAVFMHIENPADLSKLTDIGAYYLLAITFYTVIWGSRISIIYSIVRIDPNPDRRRIYLVASVLFFLAVLVMIVQLFWVCEPMPKWKSAANPQCPLTIQVAVVQLVTDVLADLFLLLAPLRVFMYLHDKRLRRKLVVIFSTVIATTIVSLVHAAYILTTGGIKVIVSALVEDNISLIVASIPVVVTSLMRNASEEDHVPPPTSTITNSLHFAAQKLRLTKARRKATGLTTTDFSTTMGNVTVGTLGIYDESRIDGSTTRFDSSGTPIVLDLLDKSGRPVVKEDDSEDTFSKSRV
ncbi:hypothetical protein D9757_001524 [Collybiopsis confluens]|uniref:Rhodopsin domain-containing protein n=1 Tax=Collybiopsis confluens TaxID=2823264 RepID=A0A8H5HZB4_9AGAR|nr:hypothetical protein D9757_001524 [Collybiopsis confluens]